MAQRRIAKATTSRPPPNITIKPAFFRGFKDDCHSIGRGIDNKYRSVDTLKAR
jgi:hypothetical protein